MNFQLNPEHRSITSICVVEDVSKCPLGYTPILRTHDSDQDADLWKDGFFGRKVTRYICVSKSQGRPEHVLNSLMILNDKEMPPDGFSLAAQTADTTQKTFQKKQLCYKLGHYRSNLESIVEIVIFNKLKTSGGVYGSDATNGFDVLGDINGMYICVRKISALTRLNSPSLGYGVSPLGSTGTRPSVYPDMHQSLKDLSMASPGGQMSGYPNSSPTSPSSMYNRDSSGGAYEYNSPQHHHPPLKHQHSSSSTLAQWSDIAGVPFVLHEDLQHSNKQQNTSVSRYKGRVTIKSETEIANQYAYDFNTERSILITNGC